MSMTLGAGGRGSLRSNDVDLVAASAGGPRQARRSGSSVRSMTDQAAAANSDLAEKAAQAASTYAGDRERYTDEKAAFVTRVMRDLDAAG
jgi:hypothetical protein